MSARLDFNAAGQMTRRTYSALAIARRHPGLFAALHASASQQADIKDCSDGSYQANDAMRFERECDNAVAELRNVARGDLGDAVHMAGAGRQPLPPSHAHPERITASGKGSLHGITQDHQDSGPSCEACGAAMTTAPKSGAWQPIAGSAAQWWQWRNVPWRSDAPARRRDEPRASRFGGLTA